MNNGKRFEEKFHRSLHRISASATLPLCLEPEDNPVNIEFSRNKTFWYIEDRSMRIFDGGAYAKVKVWGDFLFWDLKGHSWLIECKSTQKKSLPFTNIRSSQIGNLIKFDDFGGYSHSVLAINFYQPWKKDTCYLVPISSFVRYAFSTDKRSINEEKAAEIGVKCELENGIWKLDFEKVYECLNQ